MTTSVKISSKELKSAVKSLNIVLKDNKNKEAKECELIIDKDGVCRLQDRKDNARYILNTAKCELDANSTILDAVIGFDTLYDFVSVLSNKSEVSMRMYDEILDMESENMQIKIGNINHFKILAEDKSSQSVCTIKDAELSDKIKTFFSSYVSDDMSRPIMCCVDIFRAKDGKIKMTATDAHVLAINDIESVSLDEDYKEITIPNQVCKLITKFDKYDRMEISRIAVDKKDTENFVFTIYDGETELLSYSILVDANEHFPHVEGVIPNDATKSITLSVDALLKALKGYTDKNLDDHQLTFDIADNNLRISNIADDNQKSTNVPILNNEIGEYQIRFTLKALNQIVSSYPKKSNIKLNMSYSNRAVCIEGEKIDFAMLMPCYLNNKYAN